MSLQCLENISTLVIQTIKLENKEKNIEVFNNLADKLGVVKAFTSAISTHQTMKMNELMNVILMEWEQINGDDATAEMLKEAMDYSTRTEVFSRSKHYLDKLIDAPKMTRANSL